MRFLPHTRLGVLWRAALAALLVIGCTAGATAVAGLLGVKTIVGYVNQTKALTDSGVTLPQPGQPQTLLLIGADRRPGQGPGFGNTDTMLLVRIDDSSKTINLLSVPRDLEVKLPIGTGGAMESAKLNAAYSDGGAKLLLKTLKSQVFSGLRVNGIIISTFTGFSKLVNEIGCVYIDVDHRYYNNSAVTDYSSIDLEPGYQRLCGGQGSNLGGANTALAFVRFRHTDSDEVRNAAQQDFLRWAKDQYSSAQLYDQHTTLLKTFFKYTSVTHTLHTSAGIINFVDLVLNADGLELKTIQFPELYGPCGGAGNAPCYVFPTSRGAEQRVYTDFMTPSLSVPPVGHVRLGNPSPGRHHGKRGARAFHAPAGMAADPGDGRSQAAQLDGPGLPVYYPELVPDTFPNNYEYCFSITSNCIQNGNLTSAYTNSYPRRYAIDGPGGGRYPAYVMTLSRGYAGQLAQTGYGQFVTVQGTTWQTPPILSGKALIRRVNGKLLYIYSQGGQISTVAWHTRQAVYWIQNNLQNLLPNQQMVAMAATLTRARG